MRNDAKRKTSGASKERMRSLLREGGFALDERAQERLWDYYNLIVEHNEACDLTRIVRFDDFIIKHFVDSMIVARLVSLPASLLDIGTGAGFPGIPLKIIRPEISVVLAEQRSKRAEFLRMVVRRLGLEGVEIYPHAVTEHSYFQVEGVITRALENVKTTLARVAHFLPAGGRVIFMKGPAAEHEIGNGEESGYALVEKKDYLLAGTSYRRCLLVFEKKEDTMRKTYRIFLDANENREAVITSESNRRFKEWKKAVSGEGIKDFGITLVSGRRLVKERGIADDAAELVLFDGYAEDDRELNSLIEQSVLKNKVFILKKALYNELDVFNTRSALLFTRMEDMPQWDGNAADGCTLLLPFQDPSNVGSAIRSAVAFGVNRIVMLCGSAHPHHPRSVRASAGAVFHARLFRGPSLEEAIAMAGCPVVALDMQGVPLHEYAFPENFCVLPGLEGPGFPRGIACEKLSIPIAEKVESLNAAVATSIVLYAWRQGTRGRSLS